MHLSAKRTKKSPIKSRRVTLQPLNSKPSLIFSSIEDMVLETLIVNCKSQKFTQKSLPISQYSSPSIPLKSEPHWTKRNSDPRPARPEGKKSDAIPPNIRKLEKFLVKFGEMANSSEYALPEAVYTRSSSNKSLSNSRQKLTGVPARFKEVTRRKDTGVKDLWNESSRIQRDLMIIKDFSGSDLKERLELAKLARIYEETSRKEGILKNKTGNENLKWFNPVSTPIDKIVRFEI